jgi:anthranilate synthase component I
MVPVWTEVLGDLETPVAAFAKLVGDEPGFLLESVEHGERWSRFSFVGRNPSATLVLRDGVLVVDGDLPHGHPDRPGHPRRDRGPARRSYTSPAFADLPPLHGGIMGYLGYDVIREVEHLPTSPPTITACPTR